MAHLGFARTVYKSGTTGKAADRIAYITGRMATPLDFATRQLVYLTQSREDLVKEGTGNLPAWAADAHAYFSAAEKFEGKDRVAFEEWKITLPHELTRAQNEALVDDLLDTIAGTSLPYTYAFHEPRTLSDAKPQPHIHLLISARRTDEYARSAETHFKLWQAKNPSRGGARKDPGMNTQGAVKAHRLMISDMLNIHLELNGQVARVHPDSLKARGIKRAPEPKMSPGESRAYREQGVKSGRVQKVLDIRQERAAQPPHEQNNARTYWEERKAFLGITRDMPQSEKIARILLKRHGTVERVPARYRPLVERARSRQPQQRQTVQKTRSVRQHMQQLAAHLDGPEERGGRRMRVKLFDREEGLGW